MLKRNAVKILMVLGVGVFFFLFYLFSFPIEIIYILVHADIRAIHIMLCLYLMGSYRLTTPENRDLLG